MDSTSYGTSTPNADIAFLNGLMVSFGSIPDISTGSLTVPQYGKMRRWRGGRIFETREEIALETTHPLQAENDIAIFRMITL